MAMDAFTPCTMANENVAADNSATDSPTISYYNYASPHAQPSAEHRLRTALLEKQALLEVSGPHTAAHCTLSNPRRN